LGFANSINAAANLVSYLYGVAERTLSFSESLRVRYNEGPKGHSDGGQLQKGERREVTFLAALYRWRRLLVVFFDALD
jgi:hypothetical protein